MAKQLLPEQFCSKIREKLKANCSKASSSKPSSPGHDGDKKRGPLVVKYPPDVTLPDVTKSDQDFKGQSHPTGKQTCRSPSPLRPRWSKPSMIPRVSSSSPGSPSLSHRRASPPVSRAPSPSRPDSALVETVRSRLARVRRVRLYLLRQLGPHAFLVAGDSPDHKYQVHIGPQTCSCLRGFHCIHLLFVMLRVFQLHDSDPRLYARQLKNFEVEELCQQFTRRNRRLITTTTDASKNPVSRQVEDDSAAGSCPICLLEMVEEGESLVSCQTGCRNKFHHHCIAIWAEECMRQREAIHCPLCRIKNPFPLPDVSRKKCQDSPPGISTGLLPQPLVVPLPRAERLSQDKLLELKEWVQALGQEMVGCLLSRSWAVREAALRQLAAMLGRHLGRLDVVVAQVLTVTATDPVYRVYIACLRCLRALLSHRECRQPNDLIATQQLITPVVSKILLKCADGNRRTSQLSIATLIELAKGQAGALALGSRTRYPAGPEGIGGVEFVLQCLLEKDVDGAKSWQWWLGRLYVLERLMEEFPQEFYLVYLHLYPPECQECSKLIHYQRLSAIVEFVSQVMDHSHPSVNKMSQHVFILCARLSAHVPKVFLHFFDIAQRFNKSLQSSLLRKLHGINSELRSQRPHNCNKSPSPSRKQSLSRHPSFNNERFLVSEKLVSGDEARVLRSSSYSPSRSRQKSLDCCAVNRSNSLYSVDHPRPVRPKQLSLLTNHRSKDSLPSSSASSSVFNFSSEVSSPGTPPSQRSESLAKPQEPAIPSWKPVQTSSGSVTKHVDTTECHLPLIPGLTDASLPEVAPKSRGTYLEGKHWMKGCLLGTGAFSSCFQARDLGTGTLMAVKQVSYCRTSEDEQRNVMESIHEEIEMMSELRHPNILRLMGATLEGGHYNVFVEWMAGGSVAGLLAKYGPFSEPVIVCYTHQVLQGLAYLHDCHILHRDLKGANLLISGDGRTVRIGDFGAAVRLASGDTVAGEFTGQVLGTIAFMAPEVLRGEDYGRSCDVWSLGCCMLEMATTRPPWNAADLSNHWALIFKIACTREPPPIPEFLSASTKNLMLKCLETRAESRPSAHQLLSHPCFDG